MLCLIGAKHSCWFCSYCFNDYICSSKFLRYSQRPTNISDNGEKSVLSGRFLFVFMQLQDIKNHEDEAEIHLTLAFPK